MRREGGSPDVRQKMRGEVEVLSRSDVYILIDFYKGLVYSVHDIYDQLTQLLTTSGYATLFAAVASPFFFFFFPCPLAWCAV